MPDQSSPARPSQAATLARFLTALRQTERLPGDQLRAYQHRLLDTLVRHARAETDFYADRLKPLFRSDDSIDWAHWRDLPILTRAEAEANTAALTARHLPPAAGKPTPHHSSGSTGRIFHYLGTQIQDLANAAANERCFDWHGLDPASLTAFIWAMDRPEDAAWPEGRPEKPWRPGHPESRAIDLAVITPVAEQLDWLRRKRPACLATYPTNMREVGRAAVEDGTPLRFDAVLTNGEMMTDETRREIGACFGREPIDRYGATEGGLIATTCPDTSRHHVIAEIVLVEILDEHDRPVPPGHDGRIVVTPFYGLAMPLIRYDMGDWGAFAREPCRCGRTLPLLERIYGRSRNMFRFADGTRVWPVLQSWKVQQFVPHQQFQVVQTALDRIEYRYVPSDPSKPVDAAGLTAYAREVLHPSVTAIPVPVADFPRPIHGKHEDYVSLVTAPDQSPSG